MESHISLGTVTVASSGNFVEYLNTMEYSNKLGQFKILVSKGHGSNLPVTEYHIHIDCVVVN